MEGEQGSDAACSDGTERESGRRNEAGQESDKHNPWGGCFSGRRGSNGPTEGDSEEGIGRWTG